MLDVHGEAVAGATFPVPIWHLYMAAAEKGLPARQFLTPSSYPVYEPFTAGLLGLSRHPGPAGGHDDDDHDDDDAAPGSTTVIAQPTPGPAALRAEPATRADGSAHARLSCSGRWASLLTIAEALELVLERVAAARGRGGGARRGGGPRARRACALPRSICPRFPPRRWTGSRCARRMRPATLPVVAPDRGRHGRPSAALEPGEAMAIATGGVVPDGADAVVPIEDVEERDGAVVVPASVRRGRERPGAGAATSRAGEPVVAAGVRLGPVQLGALAAAGRDDACAATAGPRSWWPSRAPSCAGRASRSRAGEIYDANGLILATQIAQHRRDRRAARRRSPTTPARRARRSSADSRPTCS